MESAPLTVQGLVLLLPIGKIDWKLFILSVFCLRIGQNSKGVVEKRGMISKWELVRICYLSVMCRSFLCLQLLRVIERKKIPLSLIMSAVSDSDKQKLSSRS